MEHTFQVGDRVIIGDATKYVYEVSRCGAIGTINEVLGYGFKVALDEPHLNNFDGVWNVATGDLRHDTDFQVGDWVRHEAISNKCQEKRFNGGPYQVSEVRHDLVQVTKATKHKDNDSRYLYKENLVKIQPPSVEFKDCIIHDYPPQEEPMQEIQEDAIELGIQEKIRLLERQVEKAKCCLETYRDLKKFIDQGKWE